MVTATATALVQSRGDPPALYPRLLGDAWVSLAEPVRRLHAGAAGPHRGTFTVTRGAGWLARGFGWALGMPAAGRRVDVTLQVRRDPQTGQEIWRRTFAASTLVTAQYRCGSELAERFGAFECRFRLLAREGALCFEQTGAALRLGPALLPLPRWCWPRVGGSAKPAGERVRVEVSIAAPLVGLLIDYRGEIALGDAR